MTRPSRAPDSLALLPSTRMGRAGLAFVLAAVLALTVWAYLQPDMVLAWESLMALCAGWR